MDLDKSDMKQLKISKNEYTAVFGRLYQILKALNEFN